MALLVALMRPDARFPALFKKVKADWFGLANRPIASLLLLVFLAFALRVAILPITTDADSQCT